MTARCIHALNWLLLGLLMVTLQPVATGAQGASPVAGVASPVAESTGPTLSAQRATALPLGAAVDIGGLTIKVLSYNPDAIGLVDPDALDFIAPTQQPVAIELEVTNSTAEPLFTYTLSTRTGSNMGTMEFGSIACNVAHGFNRWNSAAVEPGETITSTVCAPVYIDAVDSLQLWIAPTAAATSDWNDFWSSGTWFDLGAPEPVTMGLSDAELASLRTTAPLSSPILGEAITGSLARVGDLVYRLDAYEPDGSATLNAADPNGMSGFAGLFNPLATLTVTNVGAMPLQPNAYLVGADGIGIMRASIPDSLLNPAGVLLPGFAVQRIFTGEALDVNPGAYALSLSGGHRTAVNGWLMPDGAVPFAFAPEIPLAAPDGRNQVNGLGAEVSLNGVNVSFGPAGATGLEYTSTITALGEPGTARIVEVSFAMGDDLCDIVTTWGSSTSYGGFFNRGMIAGAQRVLRVTCTTVDEPTDDIVATVTTYQPFSAAQTATFSLIDSAAPAPETPATVDTATATEPAATASEGSGTATVIAATANVRAQATTSGAIVDVVSSGQVVTVTGTTVEADGYTWYPIVTPSGVAGWIAGQLIQVLP